jgi:hypothetical protein
MCRGPQFRSKCEKWCLWALTVISLLWGIYSYYAGKLNPRLVYALDPNRAVLINSDSTAINDFSIQYKGNTILRKDVRTATIYLWNNGNAATHKQQILSQLKFVLPENTEILDAMILRTTRSICDIQLHRLNSKNQISIDFNILEPGDGAAVQLIYAGDPNAAIKIDGYVEGEKNGVERKFNDGSFRKNQFESLFFKRLNVYSACGLFMLMLGMLVFSVYACLLMPKMPKNRLNSIIVIAIFILTYGGLSMIAGADYGLFSSVPTSIFMDY